MWKRERQCGREGGREGDSVEEREAGWKRESVEERKVVWKRGR